MRKTLKLGRWWKKDNATTQPREVNHAPLVLDAEGFMQMQAATDEASAAPVKPAKKTTKRTAKKKAAKS